MAMEYYWFALVDEKEEDVLEKIKAHAGSMQGRHVEMNPDDDTDLMAAGQRVSSRKGETLIVATIRAWEIDADIDEDEKIREKYEAMREENGIELLDFLEKFYPDKLDRIKEDCLDHMSELQYQRLLYDLELQREIVEMLHSR